MKRIFVVLLVLWVVGLGVSHNPVVHAGLADSSHEGSLGGVLVALALCTPIAVAFYAIRNHARWQRLLHYRLKAEGISFRRPSGRS